MVVIRHLACLWIGFSPIAFGTTMGTLSRHGVVSGPAFYLPLGAGVIGLALCNLWLLRLVRVRFPEEEISR